MNGENVHEQLGEAWQAIRDLRRRNEHYRMALEQLQTLLPEDSFAAQKVIREALAEKRNEG